MKQTARMTFSGIHGRKRRMASIIETGVGKIVAVDSA
jgi:hypothetical protein